MRRYKSPLLTRHNKHSAFIALLCSDYLFPVGIVFNHHCTVFVVRHPNFRFEIRVSVISSSDNSVVVFVFSCFVRLSSNESGFCACENCRFDQSVPFFVAEIAFQPDIKHPTLKPWQRVHGFSRPIHATQHDVWVHRARTIIRPLRTRPNECSVSNPLLCGDCVSIRVRVGLLPNRAEVHPIERPVFRWLDIVI